MNATPSNGPENSILLVDDEEIILLALAETLKIEGYRVTTAKSPMDALEILKVQRVALIISDQRMGGMTGLEFLVEARKLQPNASRILITAVLTLKTVIEAINRGEIYRFLAKPWIREELLATVKTGIQRYLLLEQNEKLHRDALELNKSLAEANAQLQSKIAELTDQKRQLDAAHTSLRENFDASIELCYRILNTYHPLLGTETKAIVELCDLIIRSGILKEGDGRILRVSAWLQNLGLIGVSREVLIKSRQNADRLNEQEKRLIRNHPVYGQTLASFVDQLSGVGAVIRASHERWDGAGYPDGLRGELIPPMARILAVAIFYVECGLNREQALETILRESGRSFEPDAVRLFLKATRLAPLPRQVREVLFSELEPGMVLAKGLYSPTGLLLIPEGTVMNERSLAKIKDHNQFDPLNQRLLVQI